MVQILDLISNSFTNNHLQQWVDYIDEVKKLSHMEIQAIHHLLQVTYRSALDLTLFKLLLDDYPSLIQLLDRLVGKSEWLVPLVKPIISTIYLIIYKALMESGEFSDKQRIINTCLILLRSCNRVRGENRDGEMMGEINYEIMKNTEGGEQFEMILSNMINERSFDMIYNNFGMGIENHINFTRLCLILIAIKKSKEKIASFEYYFYELISRLDWAIDSEIVNEFSMEILESKLVVPQQKAIILLSNESLLVEKFTDCLNYLLKNPFRSPELFDDSKLILETLKIRPSLSLIFEGYLELIYKKTQHPRVFFIGKSLLKNHRIPPISMPKNEMQEKIQNLNTTILHKWVSHQYKYFHMFITSTVYMMTALSSIGLDNLKEDELFSTCQLYATQFIFGSDSSKDLSFCKDSLLDFVKDLTQCKEFTETQFKFYMNGEEEKLQSFPFNFIVHIYLCAVFSRNDSKHFSYNNVIDLAFSIMNPTLEKEQYVELVSIFIFWFEHIIELTNQISGSDTFSLRQLIVILSYLRVMSHMNDKVNQTDDYELKGHYSMIVSRFKFKYFDKLQQSATSSHENVIYSQNPMNNEAKQSLIELVTSTFEHLYNM